MSQLICSIIRGSHHSYHFERLEDKIFILVVVKRYVPCLAIGEMLLMILKAPGNLRNNTINTLILQSLCANASIQCLVGFSACEHPSHRHMDAHFHEHMDSHSHGHMDAHSHTHIDAHTLIITPSARTSCMGAPHLTHTDTCPLTQTHAHSHRHMPTHTDTCPLAQTHAHSHRHMPTHTDTCPLTHSHR